MDTNPLISVIVPVYNVAPYLSECLDSIIAQTYSNLEIILVDDGSTDDSPQICDEYSKKDERIIVIRMEKSGVCTARNTGIDRSKGEYISFVDSDDVVHPDFIKILYGMTGGRNNIITMVNGTRERDLMQVSADSDNTVVSSDDALERLLDGDFGQRVYWLVVWNKLYPRSIIAKCRFGNETIGEDTVFNVDAYRNAEYILTSPSCPYYWRIRQESTTQSNISAATYKNLVYLSSLFRKIPDLDSRFGAALIIRGYKTVFLARYYNADTQWTAEVDRMTREYHSKVHRAFRGHKFIPLPKKIAFSFLFRFPFLYAMFVRYTEWKATRA